MNSIFRNTLDDLPKYEEAAKKKSSGAIFDDETAYRELNRQVFGAKYALMVGDKDIYEKAKSFNQKGYSYDNFYNIYYAQQGKDKIADKLTAVLKSDANSEAKVYFIYTYLDKTKTKWHTEDAKEYLGI